MIFSFSQPPVTVTLSIVFSTEFMIIFINLSLTDDSDKTVLTTTKEILAGKVVHFQL